MLLTKIQTGENRLILFEGAQDLWEKVGVLCRAVRSRPYSKRHQNRAFQTGKAARMMKFATLWSVSGWQSWWTLKT